MARPGARRASTASSVADQDNSQRLKWDEANLYLTEQERSATMKIDEPKTPFVKHYDPTEDEDEIRRLDKEELEERALTSRLSNSKEEDIPGLELGEPEEDVPEVEYDEDHARNKAEKAVHVDTDALSENVGMSSEEREKHRKFEEMRKKHYQMKEVAGLLGHPDEVDALVDDDDDDDDEDEDEDVEMDDGIGIAK